MKYFHVVIVLIELLFLKPVVKCDPISKNNVGLKVTVDYQVIETSSPPDTKTLKDLFIAETIVGSITTLGHKISLPVSVDYSTSCGKTGNILREMFIKHMGVHLICH